MTIDRPFVEDIHDFWNVRAGLGQCAGSDDTIAKEIEIRAIAKYIKHGMSILEVGCGNGVTAINIARHYDVDILAIDYAEEMIVTARKIANDQKVRGRLDFRVADVQNLLSFHRQFDLIFTERVLINLPDWNSQEQAIRDICALLVKGGLFVMCENSQDGLDEINFLRKEIGLDNILPPWHNRYFRDSELDKLDICSAKLEGVEFYSSTYYFLSRIVNAWLSAKEGKEPEYESAVNQLALRLPAIVGKFGQGRIWLWRKDES